MADYPNDNLSVEETNVLILKAQAGDVAARNKVVLHNMRFVVKAAGKIRISKPNHTLTDEDLAQEGAIALAHAITKFDVSRGFTFLTYADRWIRYVMAEAIANQGRLVRIPYNKTKGAAGNDLVARTQFYEFSVSEEDVYMAHRGSRIEAREDSHEQAHNLLGRMTEREQYIMACHSGIGLRKEMTIEEISYTLAEDRDKTCRTIKTVKKRLRAEA